MTSSSPGVFVQIGLVPNTDWLKGTVKLSPRGEVEVDARGQTSVPGVFAAGDCTVVPYKQIVIAMGEGAKASLECLRSSHSLAPVSRRVRAWRKLRPLRRFSAGVVVVNMAARRRTISSAAGLQELGFPQGIGRAGRAAL